MAHVKAAYLRSKLGVTFGYVYYNPEQDKYLAVQKGCTYGYLAKSIKQAVEIFSEKVYPVTAKCLKGFTNY